MESGAEINSYLLSSNTYTELSVGNKLRFGLLLFSSLFVITQFMDRVNKGGFLILYLESKFT